MVQEFINNIAGFIREYSMTCCFAWTSSLLVIYGDELIRFTKRIARSWHFVFRVLFFVVVCGFGFGAITIMLSRFLHSKMIGLNNLTLILAVLAAYLLLGLLAEKNRVI
jgi:H+/Cl- antiporter ClcA